MPPSPLFDGFHEGKHETIPLPAQFFQDVLPHLGHLADVHVALFCFRALHQQAENAPHQRARYLLYDDFTSDAALMQALSALHDDAHALADQAIQRLLALGFLLGVALTLQDKPQTAYFVNTPRGRHAIAQIKAGQWQSIGAHIDILPERPNIYKLYEENIGILTPIIAQNLRDAETDYPHEWIQDAIRIATEKNARHWRYISAILTRWQKEGRPHAPNEGHRQQTQPPGEDYGGGDYADFIES